MLQTMGEALAIWPSCLKCLSYRGVHLKKSQSKGLENSRTGPALGVCFREGSIQGLKLRPPMRPTFSPWQLKILV